MGVRSLCTHSEPETARHGERRSPFRGRFSSIRAMKVRELPVGAAIIAIDGDVLSELDGDEAGCSLPPTQRGGVDADGASCGGGRGAVCDEPLGACQEGTAGVGGDGSASHAVR
jgi:hypothetical protein